MKRKWRWVTRDEGHGVCRAWPGVKEPRRCDGEWSQPGKWIPVDVCAAELQKFGIEVPTEVPIKVEFSMKVVG